MKKIFGILLLLITIHIASATAYVCLPANGGGWDCFGSNGNCSSTWSA